MLESLEGTNTETKGKISTILHQYGRTLSRTLALQEHFVHQAIEKSTTSCLVASPSPGLLFNRLAIKWRRNALSLIRWLFIVKILIKINKKNDEVFLTYFPISSKVQINPIT